MKFKQILKEAEGESYPIIYKLLKQYPGMTEKVGTLFVKRDKGSMWTIGKKSSTAWSEEYFNSVPGFFKKV